VVFTQLITADPKLNESDLFTEITNAETGEVLISYQPVKRVPVKKLPETVKRPPLPKDIDNIEELYLTGSRTGQFYNPTLNAMDYYNEALKRDPGDTRTNTAAGLIYLKNGDFETARKYFSRAIGRITKDYTRPQNCEALYLQGITLKELGLYEEASDTLYRASWDYAWHSASFLELARISSIIGDYPKALEQVEESIKTNSSCNPAISLKASLQRRMGDFDGALKTIEKTVKSDPLDFRAQNELYLAFLKLTDSKQAETVLGNLKKMMREYDQNYLELAAGYLNDGLLTEAEDVLKQFNGENAEITYYLGYLEDKKGNESEAAGLFAKAAGQSTDFVFPFRSETADVLSVALKYNPLDSRAYYYLGNLFYDKQPGKAIAYWEKAVETDPKFAIALRNLGWGYYHHYLNGSKAIEYYESAVSLTSSEPVYYEELDALYELSNAPVEKRLELFEGKNEIVKKRDDTFARELTVLTLAGKSDLAVGYLEGRKFSYREGDSRVRNVIIDAHLMLGRKYLEEKSFQKALEQFKKAQVPEEEAGSSRAANRNRQVSYYLGIAYEALNNPSKAKENFLLSAGDEVTGSSYINYYQGLSAVKLGRKDQAMKIFNSLISEGERILKRSSAAETDFFAKFGEKEAENARLSNGYLLIGLGNKGLGEKDKANENLKKALELSASNLIAIAEK
jgi:tetratricopeptide (TPR) repeat protein